MTGRRNLATAILAAVAVGASIFIPQSSSQRDHSPKPPGRVSTPSSAPQIPNPTSPPLVLSPSLGSVLDGLVKSGRWEGLQQQGDTVVGFRRTSDPGTGPEWGAVAAIVATSPPSSVLFEQGQKGRRPIDASGKLVDTVPLKNGKSVFVYQTKGALLHDQRNGTLLEASVSVDGVKSTSSTIMLNVAASQDIPIGSDSSQSVANVDVITASASTHSLSY